MTELALACMAREVEGLSERIKGASKDQFLLKA